MKKVEDSSILADIARKGRSVGYRVSLITTDPKSVALFDDGHVIAYYFTRG